MTRVLVTGATGFLGGALVRQLHASGIDVVALGRDRHKLAQLPVPEAARIARDLSQPLGDLAPSLEGVTAIVHCAALSSPWGPYSAFYAANVTATEALLTLGRQIGVAHFVLISTPSVYFRFADQLGVAEDTPLPKPVNAYAKTKAIAESRVAQSGLAFTILRPRGIYGRGDTGLLPRLLRAAQNGALPLLRQGQAVTDLTHVDDVVSAITAVLDQRAQSLGTCFNVSGGQALRLTQIIEAACAAHGITPRWRSLPVAPALAAVRLAELAARLTPGQPEPKATAYGLGILAYSQTLDLTRVQRDLGWRPRVSFEEGLRRTFSDNGAGV